jgi:uncharacterized protein (PEP-CTERM system associated)
MTTTMADARPLAHRLPRLALLPVLLSLAFVPHSQAEITFTPTVVIKETWSDNVNLAPSGQERSAFVTEISPGFAVLAKGPRMQLDARYQYRYFASSAKDVSNVRGGGSELQADLKSVVVDDLLYLDAMASRGQQPVSAFGPQLADNTYTTTNRTDVSAWRISPYLTHRIGSTANVLARYTRDSVQTGQDGYADTSGDAINVVLSSLGERRIGWNLLYERQDLSDELAGDSSAQTAQAGLSWRVLSPLTLTASVGYDDYDYNALGGSTQGKSWSVGYQYTPSPRTALTMRYGHRYFGKSRAMSAVHRSRKSVWNISYDEAVVTTRSQFLLPATLDTSGLLDGLFRPSFPDPEQRRQAVEAYLRTTGLPPALPNDVNFLSNRYMLQQQFMASAGFTGVRSTLLLSLYDTRREALSVRQSDSVLLGTTQSGLNDAPTCSPCSMRRVATRCRMA